MIYGISEFTNFDYHFEWLFLDVNLLKNIIFRDELRIKENILNATKRMQSDPLPIPEKMGSLPNGKLGFSPMDFPDEAFVTNHMPVSRYPSAGESQSSQAHLVQSEATNKTATKSDWTDSQQTVVEKSAYLNEKSRGPPNRNTDRKTHKSERRTNYRSERSAEEESRQKRTGYGHRRDRQRDNGRGQKRPNRENEPESGLGESDNDVNRLLNYHKTLNQQSTVPNAETMMFLAKDTTIRAQQMAAEKEIPVTVPRKKLTPEESRAREITEMIKSANNTIHFEAGDHVEDITLLPVQDKKVSLGRPEVFEAQKGKNL